jgi:SAM-dependent methyltransferase
MTEFKDHFSNHAQEYARYRPLYPVELFEYLTMLTEHGTAWDCATGNGQVAIALTPYFQQIQATDASESQLSNAFPHPKVTYSCALAERSHFPDHSIDLITVGQALHWFNFEAFYREVRRVGKRGGAIAVFSYGHLAPVSAAIDAVLQAFYQQIQPIWTPEIEYVVQEYQTIPFPFEEVTSPALKMTATWDVSQLLGYLRSWSATRHYLSQQGEGAIDEFERSLIDIWGIEQRTLEWKLFLRVGRF